MIHSFRLKTPLYNMSRLMGKPTICIGENKDADQLRGNREADQRLCFRYSDSTISLLLKSEFLACFSDCTGRFVSDLFGNHIVGFPTRWLIFSHVRMEHLLPVYQAVLPWDVNVSCSSQAYK